MGDVDSVEAEILSRILHQELMWITVRFKVCSCRGKFQQNTEDSVPVRRQIPIKFETPRAWSAGDFNKAINSVSLGAAEGLALQARGVSRQRRSEEAPVAPYFRSEGLGIKRWRPSGVGELEAVHKFSSSVAAE